ncbi:putative ABC transporter permease [Faecalispora jeddahensis]|uniref:putative ABC transporter permease n=1 Tax=Faecalispora jeddahensis TaxID=1414721 RepID=UPI00145B2942|nr:putative ABC transporter permease [Faecalispora jeddahensis]
MQTFVKLTLFFSVYSMIGWLCESIYCSIPQKRWINRGFLNGPFCPVYGFGALLILAVLSPLLGVFEFPLELIVLFFTATLLTSVLEYVTSVLLEKLFHTSWWDYSNHKYQIHGRVCLMNSLLFGVMSTLVLEVLHPLVSSLLTAIPRIVSFPLAGGLFVYFILDGTVTTIGILRMNGKLAQLQTILDEIRERTAAVAETNLAGLEHSLDELRDKADELKSETLLSLRQALEELRLKTDDVKTESIERLRNSILDFVNDENRIRLRMLQDKQEYLESQTHPMHRRIMEAFPRMRSIQSPESFQRFRQATAAARKRVRGSGSESESESGDKKE